MKKCAITGISFLVLIALCGSAFAAPNVINYQSRVRDSYGNPVMNSVAITFKFFDAVSEGSQIGTFSDTDTVTPNFEGIYSTLIGDSPDDDAGGIPASIFSGDTVYLEVSINGETLSPRQRIVSGAYAIAADHAVEADHATNADEADHADAATIADNATTATFAHNAADASHATLANNATTAINAINATSALNAVNATNADNADKLDGFDASDFAEYVHFHDSDYQSLFKRTVIVSPVGTVTQNGAALLAALASIDGATSQNPYLLKIEPGIYDVGSSSVQMKEYVDIEGSGEMVTKITGVGSDNMFSGTVMGANNCELRFLTVENTGGGDYANAVCCYYTSPNLIHVFAEATSGAVWGSGIFLYNSSSRVIDSVGKCTGTTGDQRGLNISRCTNPLLINARAFASGSNPMGCSIGYCHLTFYRCTIWSLDGRGITCWAPGEEPYDVKIVNSEIFGDTYTIHIEDTSNFNVRVGASWLSGGDVYTGGGSINCIGCFDENFDNADGFTGTP